MSRDVYDAASTLNLAMLVGRVGEPMEDSPRSVAGYYYDRNSDTHLPELPEGIVIGKVANYLFRDTYVDYETKIAMLGEGAISFMPSIEGQGQLAGDIWFDVRQNTEHKAEDAYAYVDLSLDVATSGAVKVVDANGAYWHPDALGIDTVREVLEVFELPDLTAPVDGMKYQYRDAPGRLLDPERSSQAIAFILDIVSRSEIQP